MYPGFEFLFLDGSQGCPNFISDEIESGTKGVIKINKGEGLC